MNDYNYWIKLDDEMKAELSGISDDKELEDRFYKNLEFGTGGMRGKMGAGPNRMNIYTVAKATKGLAAYLKSSGEENTSVAIAYDSRNNSLRFAKTAACALACENIKVYIFDKLQPTPVLSYAVRYLKCSAGIVITASHNPKEYNGYKVYDKNGCQLTPKYADRLIGFVNETPLEAVADIRSLDFEKMLDYGKISYIGSEVIDGFINECEALSLYKNSENLRIVYTPLHGTGNIPVRRILSKYDVIPVDEQCEPDGDFSTVRSPNPEEKDALDLAISKAGEVEADLVIGTDPDCDRVGIAVRDSGKYILLTGNQTGALLADFIMKHRALPENAAIVTTIVTSSLGADIARRHGCDVFLTLTGFKYIGEKICEWEKSADHTFIFGYEESYGYLAGTHARDKDAVSSSMLIAEMAAYHKSRGKTLAQALEEIYNEYGYYYDCLETIILEGKDGAEKIKRTMDSFRQSGSSLFDDLSDVTDYLAGVGDLPKENVLRFNFNDGSWAAVRPSGTEPKLKLYFSIKGKNEALASERQIMIKNKLLSLM